MDDNKVNGSEYNTENDIKNIEETGVFSTVESMREIEVKSDESDYPKGKKVLDFFKGFFGITAIFLISYIVLISTKNTSVIIGVLLFDLIFTIISAIAGLIVMKIRNIRFIGMGILVASMMSLVVLFIENGGCGLLQR